MILGRPTNLWLAAGTAIVNAIFLALASQGVTFEAAFVAAINLALTAIISLIASQPPTVNEGDTFKVNTANGTPNEVRTA